MYEGEDDTGTLLQSGTDADNITQIKTTQDVYIRFVSDAAFTAAGFAVRYYIGKRRVTKSIFLPYDVVLMRQIFFTIHTIDTP